MTRSTPRIAVVASVFAPLAVSCGSSDEPSVSEATTSYAAAATVETTAVAASDSTTTGADDSVAGVPAAPGDTAAAAPDGATTMFQVEVWADNWMAVYQLVDTTASHAEQRRVRGVAPTRHQAADLDEQGATPWNSIAT